MSTSSIKTIYAAKDDIDEDHSSEYITLQIEICLEMLAAMANYFGRHATKSAILLAVELNKKGK